MTLDSTMRLCLWSIKTYEMIEEWVKFMKVLDERNSLSSNIRSSLSQKSASSKKREIEWNIHDLEAFTKTIKTRAQEILQSEHKIIFMVTAIKYPPEMRKQGFYSKKRGFIIDQNDYFVQNYYEAKPGEQQWQDGERYMIEDVFEINEKFNKL